MKRLFGKAMISILLLGFAGVSYGDSNRLPKSFELPGLVKGKLDAEDFKGQTTVVEFFAAWCEGCSDVMKKLEKMSPSKKQMVIISLDEDKSAALGYFKRKKDVRHLKKLAYHDQEASLAEKLGVESLPAVFVISPTGKVIKKIHGHPSSKEYKQLRKLLKR